MNFGPAVGDPLNRHRVRSAREISVWDAALGVRGLNHACITQSQPGSVNDPRGPRRADRRDSKTLARKGSGVVNLEVRSRICARVPCAHRQARSMERGRIGGRGALVASPLAAVARRPCFTLGKCVSCGASLLLRPPLGRAECAPRSAPKAHLFSHIGARRSSVVLGA